MRAGARVWFGGWVSGQVGGRWVGFGPCFVRCGPNLATQFWSNLADIGPCFFEYDPNLADIGPTWLIV